ncbi:hypothetical protein EYF80_046405 [Liparis tanakae]|uniref:Uncharacterized protein n=1 Tax=Liparis tanakae TaxID=230148 RepID=A0A4Z2FQX8_9TELE|nr:hypothetical protein EYF80_046405 [Liparis tanakae]
MSHSPVACPRLNGSSIGHPDRAASVTPTRLLVDLAAPRETDFWLPVNGSVMCSGRLGDAAVWRTQMASAPPHGGTRVMVTAFYALNRNENLYGCGVRISDTPVTPPTATSIKRS